MPPSRIPHMKRSVKELALESGGGNASAQRTSFFESIVEEAPSFIPGAPWNEPSCGLVLPPVGDVMTGDVDAPFTPPSTPQIRLLQDQEPPNWFHEEVV